MNRLPMLSCPNRFPRPPGSPRSPARGRAFVLVVAVLVSIIALLSAPPVRAAGETTTGRAPLADASLAFTAGVLAFYDEDWEEARERFEEAVRLAPKDGTARYWLGLTYLTLGRPADAVRELRASLEAKLPPRAELSEVRSRLAEAAERVRREVAEAAPPILVPAPGWSGGFAVLPATPRVDGRLYLGVGSDSNPNLLADDLVLTTPDGELVEGAESDTVVVADARVSFQAVDEAAGRTLGLALRGRRSAYDAFDYLDHDRLEAVVQLALGGDPLGYLTGPMGYSRVPFGKPRAALLLQAGASKDLVDGESFAESLIAGAELSLNWGRGESLAGQTRVSLSYADTDFDDDPTGAEGETFGRSGEVLGGGVSQYVFLGQRNRFVRLGVRVAERDTGAAFDSSTVAFEGELSLPIASRATLFVDGTVSAEDYDEPVSNLFDPGGRPREDDELRLGAALVVGLVDRLALSGRLTWIDHDIDLPAGFAAPDLSYERTVATVGISWTF